jgi:hypothetical protein
VSGYLAATQAGDLVDTTQMTARADLTDEQWAVLEPLLPKGKKPRLAQEMEQASSILDNHSQSAESAQTIDITALILGRRGRIDPPKSESRGP